MKNVIALLIVLTIFSLFSCSTDEVAITATLKIGDKGYIGTSSEKGTAFDPAMQEYEEKFIEMLNDKDIFPREVCITCAVDVFSASVIFNGADQITDFGIYVYAAREVFDSLVDRTHQDGICVILNNDGEDYIHYFNQHLDNTLGDAYGVVCDYRSGARIETVLNSVDDLCKEFPKTKIYISQSLLEPDDIRIYNEVMGILNQQYDRSEMEIYEEIAPNYGMTADELSQFIYDLSKKMY